MRRRLVLVVGIGILVVVVIVAGSYALAQTFPADTRAGAFSSIVAGTAALALAVLTAVLLLLNWQIVEATRWSAEATRTAAAATQAAATATQTAAAATQQAAIATKEEADATREEAAASKEATLALRDQIEREWRPILVLTGGLGDISPFNSSDPFIVGVANLGRGPAINCLLALLKPVDVGWRVSTPFALGGGESKGFNTFPGNGPISSDAFRERGGASIRISIFCEDAAGIWYRFTPPNPIPEIWRQGQPQADWVPFYRAEIPGRS